MVCRRCRKIIPDGEDKLEYEGNIYCPQCYVKLLKRKHSAGEKFGIFLGVLLLILIIASWIIYIASG